MYVVYVLCMCGVCVSVCVCVCVCVCFVCACCHVLFGMCGVIGGSRWFFLRLELISKWFEVDVTSLLEVFLGLGMRMNNLMANSTTSIFQFVCLLLG